MEDDLQAIVVGIAEDVLIELHRLLLVTSEEIHLDAAYADLLHPSHVALAGDGVVHHLARSLRRIILEAIRIVPEHQLHALALRILAQLLDTTITDLSVPASIHQDRLISLGSSHIYHLDLVVVVDGVVLPDEPAPGISCRLVVDARLIERSHDIEWDGGLHDRGERLAYGDGAPWSLARQWDAGILRADAIVLALLREGDGIAVLRVIVGEATSWVGTRHARLAHQDPSVFSHLEEAREGVAHAKLRLLVHRSIRCVFLLVGWFGALPSRHRGDLRTEEGGGLLREVESAHLFIYNDRLRIVLLRANHLIVISHVVVGDVQVKGHGVLLLVEKADISLHHVFLHMCLLDARLIIGYVLHAHVGQFSHGEIL